MSDPFQRLDKVEKIYGVAFRGVVLGVLMKLDGTTTCVVEADHPDFKDVVHTYAPAQLKLRVKEPIPPHPEEVAVGQHWRHIKRGDVYTVTSLSIDEASLGWLVTYIRLNNPGELWTRRVSVFTSRFERVLI